MSIKEKLTSLADAIRSKTGTTELMSLDQMASAIDNLNVESGDTDQIFISYLDNGSNVHSLPEGLTKIRNYAFYGCILLQLTELPESVTSIGKYAFYSCNQLGLTSLPNGITTIKENTFESCYNLPLQNLPENLTSIGKNAFARCMNKLNITIIPESVSTIELNAFYYCGLKSITFKGQPTSIASNAFASCSNLTIINVPWAEGEVANAPWGATNATITYNYTGGTE